MEHLSKESIQEFIQPYKENSYIRTLLNSYRDSNPDKIRHLED
jgi:DNA polymerase-3 subunit epsilon